MGVQVYVAVSTTEIILSDFAERCEGGHFGQVNGIEKISSMSRHFPRKRKNQFF